MHLPSWQDSQRPCPPSTTKPHRTPPRLPKPGLAGCADPHLFWVAGPRKQVSALCTASLLGAEEVVERNLKTGRWKLQLTWSQTKSVTSPRFLTPLCDEGCMFQLTACFFKATPDWESKLKYLQRPGRGHECLKQAGPKTIGSGGDCGK